jgi:hypothetical protein
MERKPSFKTKGKGISVGQLELSGIVAVTSAAAKTSDGSWLTYNLVDDGRYSASSLYLHPRGSF